MAIGRAIEAQPTTAPVTAEWSVSTFGMGAYCLTSRPVILIQRGGIKGCQLRVAQYHANKASNMWVWVTCRFAALVEMAAL